MRYAAILLSVTLMVAIGHAQSYKIDINNASSSVTMPGWTALNANQSGNGGSVTLDGISFAPFSADGAFLRGSVGSPDPDALYGDGSYDNGSGEAVGLVFGGAGDLSQGTWEVSMYSWDASDQAIGNMFASYRIGGSEQSVSSTVAPTNNGPAITFRFESDGVAAYDVFFRENNTQNKCRLNAVQLTKIVPEVTSYSQTVLAQSPLEYYRMSGLRGENGDLLVKNAVTVGQTTPSPTLNTAGSPSYDGLGDDNEWANFDGSGGGTLTDVVTGWSSDEGSISYWVRLDGDAVNTETGLMGKKTGGGGVFGSMNDTIGTYNRQDGSCGLVIEGTQVNAEAGRYDTNEWRHLAMTWNRHTGAGDGVIRVYVDGVEEAANMAATWDSFVIDVARFGKETDGGTRLFKGSADELAIWTRELTQQEIVTQYWRGRREKVAIPFAEGFQGMAASSNPLDGQDGWTSPSASLIVRSDLQNWTQLGGEWAYAPSGASPAHKTFGVFAADAGVMTLEFSGRAGHKSLFGIGQENAGTFTQFLWFGTDGANMRISAYDGGDTHHQTTAAHATSESNLVRMRLVVDVGAGTGSMSYYDGTAWQSPAALQNVNLYIGSGRAANEPTNWNAVAIAGNPTSRTHDNLVVAYEPVEGTVFFIR
jgi:hypothetical protein